MDDFFRGTPFDHIRDAQIRGQIPTPDKVFAATNAVECGIPKIPSKLNIRRVGLASIGLSRPNIILARYHHFKYNVNHDIAGKILFMGL